VSFDRRRLSRLRVGAHDSANLLDPIGPKVLNEKACEVVVTHDGLRCAFVNGLCSSIVSVAIGPKDYSSSVERLEHA
jgi:hypothetical protein